MMSPQRLYIDNYFMLYFIGKILRIILFGNIGLQKFLGTLGPKCPLYCSILPVVPGILGRD